MGLRKLLAIGSLAGCLLLGSMTVFAADGTWRQENGSWYYENSRGNTLRSEWMQDTDTTWYYFDRTGQMKTGWFSVNQKWYHFTDSGAMQTGWGQVGNDWYYFNGSGEMLTGWVQVGNNWYYLEESGRMIANTERTIDGTAYRFAASGEWVQETPPQQEAPPQETQQPAYFTGSWDGGVFGSTWLNRRFTLPPYAVPMDGNYLSQFSRGLGNMIKVNGYNTGPIPLENRHQQLGLVDFGFIRDDDNKMIMGVMSYINTMNTPNSTASMTEVMQESYRTTMQQFSSYGTYTISDPVQSGFAGYPCTYIAAELNVFGSKLYFNSFLFEYDGYMVHFLIAYDQASIPDMQAFINGIVPIQ